MKNKPRETEFTRVLRVAHHLFILPRFGTALLGLVIMSGSAWAATSAIEGIVKDPKGQAISGADVRIEARSGTSWSTVVKTDAKGHYLYNGLDVGVYRVSLLVNGSVKASINNVKAKLGDPTKLNFALTMSSSSRTSGPGKKKATHMVWVPSETGSHTGGRWVEVDDNGNVNTAGSDRVTTVGNDALRELQNKGPGKLNMSPNGP